MWIPRTVRILTSQPTSAANITLTINSVALNGGFEGQMRILKIKAWNYTNQGASSNYIQMDTTVGLTETAVTTSVNDVGCSSNLPGVMVQIPRTIASNQASTSTNTLCKLQGTPVGNPTSVQSFIVDVQLEYKTDSTD